MSYFASTEFLIEVAKGNVPGHSIVHKFGESDAIGTTFAPVTIGNVYQTPQVASATTLRIKSGGDANDTAAGTGAREVTVIGLDETGAEVSEAIATAGASASAATTITFMRLWRITVSASGTYATAAAPSHSGDIVIENGSGGTDWGTITSSGFPRGQSSISVYSVPLGKTAYMTKLLVNVDSAKAVDILLFGRENILETSAPYAGSMKTIDTWPGIRDVLGLDNNAPFLCPAVSDVGFMGKVASGTGSASISFELLIVDAGF